MPPKAREAFATWLAPGTLLGPRSHKGPVRLAPGTIGAPGSGGPTIPHSPGILTGPRSRQVKELGANTDLSFRATFFSAFALLNIFR